MNYFLDKDGYKILNKGKAREHRVVMEQYLGRTLTPQEQVHHLDGNKLNNDIANLVLCASRSEHLRKYHSVSSRKGKITLHTYNCVECGKEFTNYRRGCKYCSVGCSSLAGSKAALKVNIKHIGCQVEGCNRKHGARGYCKFHYYKDFYPSTFTSGAYLH